MKRNRGYTLIEVIIVIAIIAILSGLSVVTLGIIRNAKAQAAATTLSDQMQSLLIKTKALSSAKGETLCMKLEYVDEKREIGNVTARAGSYLLILGTHKDSGFVARETDKVEAVLPDLITIEYEPSKGQSTDIAVPSTDAIIEFNKSDGSVRSGAGVYTIRYNGNIMSYVVLDATTGNHYVTGSLTNNSGESKE